MQPGVSSPDRLTLGEVSDVVEIPIDELIRTMTLRPGEIATLLGAGCSVAAGIPAADVIMWMLRARLAESRLRRPPGTFDPSDPLVRRFLQNWIKDAADLPDVGDPDEYGQLFEKAYQQPADRRRFFDEFLTGRAPSYGHHVLAALCETGALRIMVTTNFDRLVEDAIADLAGTTTVPTVASSSAAASSEIALAAMAERRFPLLIKLHGDYQYEYIRNTEDELREQDIRLRHTLANIVDQYGLFVIGYSGRDASVMAALTEGLEHPRPYPAGLYWCLPDGVAPSDSVVTLLSHAAQRGVRSGIVRAGVFDDIFGMLGDAHSLPKRLRDRLRDLRPAHRAPFRFPAWGARRQLRLGLNALQVTSAPDAARLFRSEDAGTTVEVRRRLEDHLTASGQPAAIAVRRKGGIAAFGPDDVLESAFAEWTIDGRDMIALRPVRHKGDLDLRYDALTVALIRARPLIRRRVAGGWRIVVAPQLAAELAPLDPRRQALDALRKAIRPRSGGPIELTGELREHDGVQFDPPLQYGEAVDVRLEVVDRTVWLVFGPTVDVSPLPYFDETDEGEPPPTTIDPDKQEARSAWRRARTEHRYNAQWSSIIGAWRDVLLADAPQDPNGNVRLSACDIASNVGVDAVFAIGTMLAVAEPTEDTTPDGRDAIR